MSREDRLASLRQRIIHDLLVERWTEVWFFPAWKGVKGWQGIQDIMFVGLNPSTGRFPSKPDQFLYQELKARGFENAHLTDLIKVRATADVIRQMLDEKDSWLLNWQRRYFLEEVNILQPHLIVPMGRRTAEVLRRWLPNHGGIVPLPHYSPRIPTNENLARFSLGMLDVRIRYYGDGSA